MNSEQDTEPPTNRQLHPPIDRHRDTPAHAAPVPSKIKTRTWEVRLELGTAGKQGRNGLDQYREKSGNLF